MKNKKKNLKTNIEKPIKNLIDQYFKNTKEYDKKGYLYDKLIQRVERQLIKQVLKNTEQNQLQTAKILGISRSTLRKKMATFSLFEKTKNTDKID